MTDNPEELAAASFEDNESQGNSHEDMVQLKAKLTAIISAMFPDPANAVSAMKAAENATAAYLADYPNNAEDVDAAVYADLVLPLAQHPELLGDLDEEVHDGLADEVPQRHEAAVDAVQQRLEVVALPGVLRVEQLQQVQDEALAQGLPDVGCVDLVGHHEPQQQLVDDLVVGPGLLQVRLVLVRVQRRRLVGRRRAATEGPEDVGLDGLHELGQHGAAEDGGVDVEVVDELEEGVLLGLAVLGRAFLVLRVSKVKRLSAQSQLGLEQLDSLRLRYLFELGQGLEGVRVEETLQLDSPRLALLLSRSPLPARITCCRTSKNVNIRRKLSF